MISRVGLLTCLLLCAAACHGDGPDRRGIDAERENVPALVPETGVAGVLREHMARYPEMEVQDLYKLIYQAANGSGHAARDSLAARQRFEEEIEALQADATGGATSRTGEPLTERITSRGDLVRVNLRPYLAAGGDPEALWRAFVRTSGERPLRLDSLRVWWSEVEALAAGGEVPFPREALHLFYVRQAVSGFPTAHHSSHYEQRYRPAYRVIAANRLPLPPR